MHPSTNADEIIAELDRYDHKVVRINCLRNAHTKAHIPLFRFRENSKEVYTIKTLLNMVVQFGWRAHSKLLRILADAPWYVRNHVMRGDLRASSVEKTIRSASSKHAERPEVHPNPSPIGLRDETSEPRCPKRRPLDSANIWTKSHGQISRRELLNLPTPVIQKTRA